MSLSGKPYEFVPWGNLHHLLLRTRDGWHWRPTAVAIVQLGNRFMVLRSWKKRNGKIKSKRDITKGGVERHQTIMQALRTELFEEARIRWCDVVSVRPLGYALVPFDDENLGRDGYSDGKAYLLFHVVLRRGARFAPGRDHRVTQVLWREDFHSYFKPTEKHKNGARKKRAKEHKETKSKSNDKYKVFSQSVLRARVRAQRRV